MSSVHEASVAQWKKDLVDELLEKFEGYSVVGVMDISGIPAPQFQQIREILRGKAEIKVSRRVLLQIAIEKSSKEKSGLEGIIDHLEGPCALVFTDMNPFKLWKLLDENKTNAPAKVGMEAPEEVVIPEGDTEFSPGPVISELQQAGVKARIQAGKVVVTEDSKIVEKGEPISEEVAGVLSRFGIEPREIGFELKAAYEDGTVFPSDVLVIDEEEVLEDIQRAYKSTMNLSVEAKFPTKQNISIFVNQAYTQTRNLALNASIFNSETVPQIFGEAHSEMLSLASTILSSNPDAIDEELSSIISTQEPAEKAKKEEGKPKEEEKEKAPEEEKTEEEEEEPSAGLGGLFD